ncbi:MAG TPA: DUF4157 domain-containing protein [Longimicrobium sp.]|nr:DUF4157 domain-containing protein [Longimicrobium sp.]
MHMHAASHSSPHARQAPAPRPVLRRSCACGGATGPSGECESCRKKRLQRAASSAGPAVAPPIVHDVLRSAGAPLDAGTRAQMEPRFRHSFADVRVHADSTAAESARAVGAHAYAVGPHVVFGAGRYAPGSAEGRRLIAHELAHVVQQRGSASASIQPKLEVGAADHPAEREADLAARAVAGDAAVPALAGRGAVLRRQTPPDGGMDGVDAGPRQDAGTAPDAGVPPDAAQAPSPAQDAGAAPPSPPPASPPPCTPTALPRAQYLTQPGTSTGDFGLTTLAGQVTLPVVRTTRGRGGGVRVEPTSTALPPITSVFTGAGVFMEDTITWTQQEPGVGCRTARYPIRWNITGPGAARIQAGEVEHCADFMHAFTISLRRYADAVNGLAASRRVFSGATAAEAAVTRAVGVAPSRWMEVFECLAQRTLRRDGGRGRRGWHTPRARMIAPREGHCAFAEAIVDGNALPEVGVHTSAAVIQGCGEAPPPTPSPGAGATGR